MKESKINRQTKPKSGAVLPETDLRKQLRELEGRIREKLFAEVEGDERKVQQLMAGIEAMRKDLATEHPSQVESFAIEQLVTAWTQSTISALRLQEIEPRHRNAREGSFWERRHHLAQSRVLRSLELLGRLKKVPLSGLESEGVTIRVEYVDMPDYRRSLGAG